MVTVMEVKHRPRMGIQDDGKCMVCERERVDCLIIESMNTCLCRDCLVCFFLMASYMKEENYGQVAGLINKIPNNHTPMRVQVYKHNF